MANAVQLGLEQNDRFLSLPVRLHSSECACKRLHVDPKCVDNLRSLSCFNRRACMRGSDEYEEPKALQCDQRTGSAKHDGKVRRTRIGEITSHGVARSEPRAATTRVVRTPITLPITPPTTDPTSAAPEPQEFYAGAHPTHESLRRDRLPHTDLIDLV
jgi:hypothetical protein